MANNDVRQILQTAIGQHQAGRLREAEALYRQILQQRPDDPDALHLLGYLAYQSGKADVGIELIGRAIAIRPIPQYYSNLGNVLKAMGRVDEAIGAYRRAIELKADYSEAYNNLGNALKDTGLLDEGIAAYRKAIALKPDYAAAHSNMLYAMHYHQDYGAMKLYEEHCRWNELHARGSSEGNEPHGKPGALGAERRLRIGYVSPDFRGHIVGLMLLPLFREHDRERFEVFCYADVVRPDAVTEELRLHSDTWRSIVGMSDEQVALQVRADKIDILIDLTLHMAKSRLLVFARKPAPVQVTYLGYPSTTGLAAMDYRISDPYLDPLHPVGVDPWYSEKTVRLPHTFLCWQWNGPSMAVGALPAGQVGHVTFGCLNNFCKVNPGVLEAWGRILLAVNGSRLILLCPAGSAAQRVRDFMARCGVSEDRLELAGRMPREQYTATLQRIDIGLDSFPYTGHTTTCDSLWMGVPVMTLAGGTAVSRGSASILNNVGLGELVMDDVEEYVALATRMARELPWLAELRAGLRQRMEQSALMDAKRFARDMEAAYRRMWGPWCGENTPKI